MNSTLYWICSRGHAVQLHLFMQYAGYVYADYKLNICSSNNNEWLLLEVRIELNFDIQIPYYSTSPHSNVCCKHQYGGLIFPFNLYLNKRTLPLPEKINIISEKISVIIFWSQKSLGIRRHVYNCDFILFIKVDPYFNY